MQKNDIVKEIEEVETILTHAREHRHDTLATSYVFLELYDVNRISDTLQRAREALSWVPVSERLPEEGIVVIISCERSSQERFTDVGVILQGDWHYAYTTTKVTRSAVNVAHWKPLPPAYTPEES